MNEQLRFEDCMGDNDALLKNRRGDTALMNH